MRNKIALITGATGSVGAEIALLFAENKINLLLHYNSNTKKALEIKRQCEDYGISVALYKADVSRVEEINILFTDIKKTAQLPDILINTVGKAFYGLIQDVSYQDWDLLIRTNVMSTYFSIQNVLPQMIANKYGRIINVSSIWGEIGCANESLYSLTKGAINNLTKSLAKELGPSGITVNAIAPGFVPSKMNDCFSQEELQALKAEIPLHRFSKTIEIAQTALHLIHDNSEYINGQIITVDGGLSLI